MGTAAKRRYRMVDQRVCGGKEVESFYELGRDLATEPRGERLARPELVKEGSNFLLKTDF